MFALVLTVTGNDTICNCVTQCGNMDFQPFGWLIGGMMENTILYIVNGDIDEVSAVVDPVRMEGRFLSDTPNVVEFKWYPEEDGQLTAEIRVSEDNPVDLTELSLLTQEYISLFISIGVDSFVDAVVNEGRVEVVA